MAKRTKKLLEAGKVLADERFCDSDDEAVVRAVLAGKISSSQVYRALHHFGYRWKSGRWTQVYPGWISNFWKLEI